MTTNFGTIFCEANHISSKDFCKALLIASARWYVRPLIRFIIAFNPIVFSDDFHHLEPLRATRTRNEFVSEMMSLEDYNKHNLSRWRKVLGARASIGKLSKMSIRLRSKKSA